MGDTLKDASRPKLTKKQRQVADRIVRGLTAQEIASDMGVSRSRVYQQVQAVKSHYETTDMEELRKRHLASIEVVNNRGRGFRMLLILGITVAVLLGGGLAVIANQLVSEVLVGNADVPVDDTGRSSGRRSIPFAPTDE